MCKGCNRKFFLDQRKSFAESKGKKSKPVVSANSAISVPPPGFQTSLVPPMASNVSLPAHFLTDEVRALITQQASGFGMQPQQDTRSYEDSYTQAFTRPNNFLAQHPSLLQQQYDALVRDESYARSFGQPGSLLRMQRSLVALLWNLWLFLPLCPDYSLLTVQLRFTALAPSRT